MAGHRIQDIASFRQLLEQSHNLELLRRAYPLFKPLLKLARVDTGQVDDAPAQVAGLAEQVRAFIAIPDRFNDLFTRRGWIMYDYLSLTVAKAAIAEAEAGDLDKAEQLLVEYYDEQTLGYQITRLAGTKAFRPRVPLARKALTDYAQGRYHASIPVTLMLLDGMVDDLGFHGFFAKDADLEAWDSVAAHGKGLVALAKVLSAGRYTTTTEPLTLPYRNGILHGHDLNYDNQLVAAKAWAALFAAGDLARKVERGERTAPPPQPAPTWREILDQTRETERTRAQIAAWRPRSIQPGTDIPTTGEPQDYGEGTPERALVGFLSGWQRSNYGRMAGCIRGAADQHRIKKLAGELRAHYAAKPLRSFALLELHDAAPAVTVITVKLTYEQRGATQTDAQTCRLINEDAGGHGAVRGQSGTRWILYSPYI